MKAVVTGGAGFIGSHIADALLARGDEVHVVDDLSLGKSANVPARATVHVGSILDEKLLKSVFRGATAVFHEAALPSVARSIEDPRPGHDVNATGTLAVLEAARAVDVGKVVFAASSSAYGDTPTLPKHEDMPVAPKSPYAVGKVAGELYCRVFHEVYGLRTTALRYFNVYGPRQDPQGAYAAVVPRFIESAFAGRPLAINGDGSHSRDFTFVGDAAAANILALGSTASDGKAINVAGGKSVTIDALARSILELTRSSSKIVHGEPRAGDIAHSLADLSRARALLGYEPRTDLRAGLALTIASLRSAQTQRGPTA